MHRADKDQSLTNHDKNLMAYFLGPSCIFTRSFTMIYFFGNMPVENFEITAAELIFHEAWTGVLKT